MLTWTWSKKHGEMDIMWNDKKYTVNLYESNALLCAISEWKEDGEKMYNMYTFWCDKDHAKNCLGLTKGHNNLMTSVVEVRLNAASDYSKPIGDLFLTAMKKQKWDIKLSYYYEEMGEC